MLDVLRNPFVLPTDDAGLGCRGTDRAQEEKGGSEKYTPDVSDEWHRFGGVTTQDLN